MRHVQFGMLLGGAMVSWFANAQSTPAPASGSAPATAATAPATAAAPRGCTGSTYRQFDFWVGDWDVLDPKGNLAGTNLIRPILGRCVLHENWAGKGGVKGESFNGFDVKRNVWHQTWMDASGGVLMLEGAFIDGSMTLSDRTLPGKADPNAVNEITWTPNADGSVRQHWRASKDGGKTWTTAFDGRYVRSSRAQPER